MIIVRKLKLYSPNKTKEKRLIEIARKSNLCINYWLDRIREKGSRNIKRLYSEFHKGEERFALTSEIKASCLWKAVSISRKSIKSVCRENFIVIKGRNIKIDKNNIGVSLGGERTWIPFKSQAIPPGKMGECIIKKTRGEWYCYLPIKIQEPKIKTYKNVLGVDVGLAKIATLSDKKGKHTKFYRGESLRKKRQHYYNLRKKAQPKIGIGNVYKFLKKISKKETNWMRDCNHKISRNIVNYAKSKKMTISVENLAGIRDRIKATRKVRRMLHSWSFRQLINFIEYKARLEGIAMLAVDPRETSRRGPKCGHTSMGNRLSQSRFKCNKCGYESNADRIGAMNIAIKGTELLASHKFTGNSLTP